MTTVVNNHMNQSELEAHTCRPCQARVTRASKSRLALVSLLIGRGSGARCFNQSQSVAMQKRSNCGITFDTQLKSALTGHHIFLLKLGIAES